MKTTAPIIAVLGGLLLLFGGGTEVGPTPERSPAEQLLRDCAEAETAAKLDLLRKMAAMEFLGSTPGERAIPASDWWLEQSAKKRIEAQTPFTDALAEAINAETVGAFVGAK